MAPGTFVCMADMKIGQTEDSISIQDIPRRRVGRIAPLEGSCVTKAVKTAMRPFSGISTISLRSVSKIVCR